MSALTGVELEQGPPVAVSLVGQVSPLLRVVVVALVVAAFALAVVEMVAWGLAVVLSAADAGSSWKVWRRDWAWAAQVWD